MPTRNAIAYTLDHLLRVAFPNFANTIETDGSRAEATVAGIRIVFPLVDTDSHQKMMNGKLSAERLEAPTGKEIPAFRCRDEEGISASSSTFASFPAYRSATAWSTTPSCTPTSRD